MNRGRALAALAAALGGRVLPGQDWMELLEAANRALVTPSLREALQTGDGRRPIPQDALEFMDLVAARNDERNGRLGDLAVRAVAALNAAGVVPIYLKGMAVWAATRPDEPGCPRMMSDVDLLIDPGQAEGALEALCAAGFRILSRYPEKSPHIIAELAREGDVGMLDLHRAPPGPARMVELFDRQLHTRPAPWPGEARVPLPASQIYLTAVHDMFHDGGFWRGGFDVRHLCDIAALASSPEGVDWGALDGLLATRAMRSAVRSQLIAASRIAAAPIPPAVLGDRASRLHYRRHLAQYAHASLYLPLAALGFLLELPNRAEQLAFVNRGRTSAPRSFRAKLDRFNRVRSHPNKI